MHMPELPSWWKVVAFTINLMCGLVASQVTGAFMDHDSYHIMVEVVSALTMWALSFIMINVGYEFTIDKKDLPQYGWDYLIAMTAAGFPWLFVALWFLFTFEGMAADQAFLVARFAAPTSAGILFSMLEGAGLRETWVFQKARILAIFDDLDTILLMIPLKIIMIGFKWELLVTVGVMVVFLGLAWFKLHALRLPYSWAWTLLYAAIVGAFCKMLHYITHHYAHDMEPIHIEVLLPAFVIGCVIDTPCAQAELAMQRQQSLQRKLTRALGKQELQPAKTKSTAWAEEAALPCKQTRCISDASTAVGHTGPEPGGLRASGNAKDEAREHVVNVAPYAPSPPGCVIDETELAANPPLNEERQTSKSRVPSKASAGAAASNPKRRPSKGSTSSEGSKGSKRLSRHGLSSDDLSQLLHQSQNPLQPRVAETIGVEQNSGKPEGPEKSQDHGHEESEVEHSVQTAVSMVFMVLVGLSMPPLFGHNAKDSGGGMDAGVVVAHVVAVSILMVLGKMFPAVCYRDEVNFKSRLALCLGMCPRGEVGASIIVISLELGVEGPAIIVAMFSLVINLVSSGIFIGMVKVLLRGTGPQGKAAPAHDELPAATEPKDLRAVAAAKMQAECVHEECL